MNANQSERIIRRVAGYWPTPAMTDEEAVAWTEQLTDPEMDVTPAETLAVIRKAIYAGDVHRPRAGQVAAAVKAERRWQRLHDDTKALSAGRVGACGPERARQWIAVCRRMAAGEQLEDASRAVGID